MQNIDLSGGHALLSSLAWHAPDGAENQCLLLLICLIAGSHMPEIKDRQVGLGCRSAAVVLLVCVCGVLTLAGCGVQWDTWGWQLGLPCMAGRGLRRWQTQPHKRLH